jgi:FlaG/FlaF family flagellin (archaellin)
VPKLVYDVIKLSAVSVSAATLDANSYQIFEVQMRKRLSIIAVLLLLAVLFSACNSKQTTTTPMPTQGSTPTPTAASTPVPENLHASGEISDNEGVIASAMSLVVEGQVQIIVETVDGQSFTVKYDTTKDFSERSGKLDIAKVDGGYLIIAKTTMGHYESILAEYFDGEALRKVDFPYDESLSADKRI